MTLEEMKKIAARRTNCLVESDGSRVVYNINENCVNYIGGFTRGDAEFIAMAANNWDQLLAVVEAAQRISEMYYVEGRSTLFVQSLLKDALAALERE